MRIRILSSIAALVGAFAATVSAHAQGAAWRGPAFLDGFDEIRLWLPEATQPDALKGKVTVTLDGRPIRVASIEGAEKATRANDPNFVVLPGTIQSALGARDWDPAGDITRMTRVADGVFEFVARLPRGRFEYKVARGGGWAENYGLNFSSGGANIAIELDRPQIVRFVVDFNQKTIRDSINHPNDVKAPAELPARPPVQEDPRDQKYQSVRVKLGQPLVAGDLSKPMTVQVQGGAVRPVYAREVLSHPMFQYERDDLGSRWTRQQTTFKVWSPVAKSVDLVLFPNAKAPASRTISMQRGAAGVWFATVRGDLHGTYYQYHFDSYGEKRVAADINGYAASADSSRSMVVDLSRTNPEGWPVPRLFQGKRHTDAVLYELHIRDFTVDPSSGVRPEWRGKYLGFTQHGTRVPGTNFVTGIDYLKDLGVTHVHILPMQDFNPAHSEMYNWGYETTLFNVPEEQYAVDRHDALGRIRETKLMIREMQRAGIGVVLDVVYNHSVPSQGNESAFWATVPYYYFRTNDRGDVLNESGVGNALHDERPMVRKYIRDSLVFWTREYRIDGYRFDLIGMFTRETNADLAKAIRSVNPSAVIYGEPWTGGGPTRFGKGDQRGTGVAVFNDRFRGAFRGELDGPGPGFAMGGSVGRVGLMNVLAGSVSDFTDSPQETVNYVSAHDNLTFWDKVALSLPNSQRPERERAVRLAHVAVLLSQGMPFIEGGVQLGRTKNGNNNSYNAGDEANKYDWKRALDYVENHRYFKGLIALRKAQPLFRLGTKAEIERHMTFLPAEATPGNTIAYRLHGLPGGWSEIVVVLHGSRTSQTMRLPAGDWSVAVDHQNAGTSALRSVSGTVRLEPLSALVLFRR